MKELLLMEGEQIKPLSELLSAEELEQMLNQCIHEVELLREVYKADVEYYMNEVKTKSKKLDECYFKITELETALKIKSNTIEKLETKLNEYGEELGHYDGILQDIEDEKERYKNALINITNPNSDRHRGEWESFYKKHKTSYQSFLRHIATKALMKE